MSGGEDDIDSGNNGEELENNIDDTIKGGNKLEEMENVKVIEVNDF